MNILKIMRNKKPLSHLLLASLLMFGVVAHAIEILEHAMEVESLRISLNDDGSGFVQGKLCDDCKRLTLAVTAETRAFQNNAEVPLKQAADRLGKSATVFINVEHTQVTRIKW